MQGTKNIPHLFDLNITQTEPIDFFSTSEPETKTERVKNRRLPPRNKDHKVTIKTSLDSAFDDGYNWRNYGKTAIKGNRFPRFYFRCRVSSCPIRKHVELSSEDGSIVTISYCGEHNHSAPRYWKNMLKKVKEQSRKNFDLNLRAPEDVSLDSNQDQTPESTLSSSSS